MPDHPVIHYELSAPDPRSHYFHVRLHFQGPIPERFTLALPVWTPGSYLVREYARHVINLTATTGTGSLPIERLNKAAWTISVPPATEELTVDYDVYAYELTVRSSYLDRDYGLASPTSLFMYHEPWKPVPYSLSLQLPDGWEAATGLTESGPNTYRAADYDILADSPIQMGRLTRYPFTVGDVPHELVVAGPGADRLPRPSFLEDLARIIETARDLFGGLPYAHYHFLVTLAESGGGGLEHLNSANIMLPPKAWRTPDDYQKVMSLFAHEYFHLWNVKRLHPDNLGPFDYQHEVYTSLLWALEGITDYFAPWLLAQSGVVPADKILAHWASSLHQLEQLPGRWVTPLADSSRETWIRQYRPDANTANITISYYLKGALAGLYLDLELRRHSQGRASLAAVMRELWNRYGDHGYPEAAFEALIIEMGGPVLKDILDRYVHGTEAFDDEVFQSVGLTLERGFKQEPGERPAWLGVSVVDRQGRLYARSVERGGPAEAAGLSPDDEIIALNGQRIVTSEQWQQALVQVEPGQSLEMAIIHQGQLQILHGAAQPSRPDQYQFKPLPEADEEARQAFRDWLGVPFADTTA